MGINEEIKALRAQAVVDAFRALANGMADSPRTIWTSAEVAELLNEIADATERIKA